MLHILFVWVTLRYSSTLGPLDRLCPVLVMVVGRSEAFVLQYARDRKRLCRVTDGFAKQEQTSPMHAVETVMGSYMGVECISGLERALDLRTQLERMESGWKVSWRDGAL